MQEKLSDRLERWFNQDEPRTLGGLIDTFGEKSFAVLFIVLMAVPALPLPTGGVTHVFEVITMLLALELIVGRRTVWLPERWKRVELGGTSRRRFVRALLARIRSFERFSRPRLTTLLCRRLGGVIFGVVVFALSLTALLRRHSLAWTHCLRWESWSAPRRAVSRTSTADHRTWLIGALGAVVVIAVGSLVVHLLQ